MTRRIAIVSPHQPMRRALSQCLGDWGYHPVSLTASAPEQASDCAMALVDLNDYQANTAASPVDLVEQLPTLFIDQPLPREAAHRASWQRQLARKIALAEAENRYGQQPGPTPAWLLLASAGGPQAVCQFIDALPNPCPAGLLYGQHIEPGFEHHLLSMLDGRNGLTASLAQTGQRLQPGHIVISPADRRLTLVDGTVLMVENQPWPGQYQPSLEALTVEFNRRRNALDGVIVFSGMGADGSTAASLYAGRGGRLWAQTPDSCVVSAMPEATLARAAVSRCAAPSQLAQHLAALYLDQAPGRYHQPCPSTRYQPVTR